MRWSTVVFAVLSIASAALGQTVTFTKTVIDPNPPDNTHWTKAVGLFTSTAYPSFYLGTERSGYIYDGQTGKRFTVDNGGFHYEKSRAFTWHSKTIKDSFAGIMTALSGQVVWEANPANWNGGNPYAIWPETAVLDSWAHVVVTGKDFDGDGLDDVAISATNAFGVTHAQLSFQNSGGNWTPVVMFGNAGEDIAVFSYNGLPHLVGCSGTSLNWWQNPGGAAGRTFRNWIAHYIGPCTIGTSLNVLNIGSRSLVIQASNESGSGGVWADGLAYFDPGSNPTGPWQEVRIDPGYPYRDVHQISTDTLNGIPFIVVGEQEQASSTCNNQGYNDHPSAVGCRVALFQWTGSGFGPPTILSQLGTHNQDMMQFNGKEVIAGANHDSYSPKDRAFNLWTVTFGSGGGGGGLVRDVPYTFQDASGNTMDLGWTQPYSWANRPFVYFYTYNANPWQQLIYTSSNQLKSFASGQFLYDNGGNLGVGGNGASFSIVPSGSGVTIQNVSTGLYVNGRNALSPPNNLFFSSTPEIFYPIRQ